MALRSHELPEPTSFHEVRLELSYLTKNLPICFMVINLNRKTLVSDAEVIHGIQNRNESVTESFFYECKKYFMSSYKAIFYREDIKDDIFQQSFVKLWTEIETKKIIL